MRKMDSIIIHCSATRQGADFGAADIARWHRQRGFRAIGYHYVIRLDGTLEKGRPIEQAGAHCKGWNATSIGICYIGGLDTNGKPADTRTPEQIETLAKLVKELQRKYGIRQVMGHRDTSPDRNGNGEIEPEEYIKACPCFDVRMWMKESLLVLVVVCLLASCGSHKSVRYEQSQEKMDSSAGYVSDSMLERQMKVEWNGRKLDRLEQTVLTFRQDSFTREPVLATVVHTRSRCTEEQVITEHRREEGRQKQMEQHRLQQETVREEERQESRERHSVWLEWGIGGMAVLFLLFFCRFTRK